MYKVFIIISLFGAACKKDKPPPPEKMKTIAPVANEVFTGTITDY